MWRPEHGHGLTDRDHAALAKYHESEEPGGGVMEAEDLQVLPSRLGGLGLMARRSFRKGEVVLVERPFLTVGELLQRSRNSRTA
jgi:hypothetical protein